MYRGLKKIICITAKLQHDFGLYKQEALGSVIVKRALTGSKDGWTLSSIFKL